MDSEGSTISPMESERSHPSLLDKEYAHLRDGEDGSVYSEDMSDVENELPEPDSAASEELDEAEPDDDMMAGSDYETEGEMETIAARPEPARPLPKMTTAEQIFSRFGPALNTVAFPLSGKGIVHIIILTGCGAKIPQLAPAVDKRCGLYYRVFGGSPNVVRHCYERAGFRRRDGVAGWNGMWGRHLRPEALKRLTPYQKVCRLCVLDSWAGAFLRTNFVVFGFLLLFVSVHHSDPVPCVAYVCCR